MAGADTDEAWRTAFEVDVMGTIHTVRSAQPYLEKSDAGAIVAIGSVAALQYFGGVRAYNTMKAALINHMSNLAHELAPKGLRVNVVSPGTIYFKGGIWHQREQETPEIFKGALGLNPMGRMGTPEEVAARIDDLSKGGSLSMQSPGQFYYRNQFAGGWRPDPECAVLKISIL